MKKNYKFVIAFLFITFVSFFRTSNVLAGGDIVNNDVKITPTVKVESKKTDVAKELIFNSALSSPTIISPKSEATISYDDTITGAVSSGAVVRVFIDGKLDGEIKAWNSKTGISAFFYTPKQKLTEGLHFVKAQTVKNGFYSAFSEEIIVNKVEAYEAPIVRAPYYYKDDYKTFVVRGYANSEDVVDVYLDGKKIKTLNLPKSKEDGKKVSFLYAIHNLSEGKHSGYFVAYEKGTNKRSYNSKKFYFTVQNPELIASETKTTTPEVTTKTDTTKQEVTNKDNDTTKVEDNKTNTNTTDNKNTETKVVKEKGDEKNKSMTIGIILLICSFVLMVFWVITENQEKIKKFVDKLLDEEEDDNDKKDDKGKTL